MAYDPDAPPTKPSAAPSWIFLGFVLGALCMLALPSRKRAEPAPEPVPVAKPEPPPPPRPTRFDEVQTVFSAYSQYAVWQDERTEICMYDPDLKRFAECYEVLRSGDQMYFRSIPSLTRPVLTHGVPQNSPVEFTEPKEARAQWLKEVHDENWKDFTEGVRQGMNADHPVPAPVVPPPAVKPELPHKDGEAGSK